MKLHWIKLAVPALLAAMLVGCASAQTQDDGQGTDDGLGESTPDIAVAEEMDITLYLPNETADGFEEVSETVKAQPQGIVDALIAHEALPADVVVNSFELDNNGTETQEGDVVSYEVGDTLHIDLDLSAEFAEGLNGMGSTGEGMMLGSLVNTLLSAYNADTITVTCDGAVLETGHNVYDEPLSFMQMSQ